MRRGKLYLAERSVLNGGFRVIFVESFGVRGVVGKEVFNELAKRLDLPAPLEHFVEALSVALSRIDPFSVSTRIKLVARDPERGKLVISLRRGGEGLAMIAADLRKTNPGESWRYASSLVFGAYKSLRDRVVDMVLKRFASFVASVLGIEQGESLRLEAELGELYPLPGRGACCGEHLELIAVLDLLGGEEQLSVAEYVVKVPSLWAFRRRPRRFDVSTLRGVRTAGVARVPSVEELIKRCLRVHVWLDREDITILNTLASCIDTVRNIIRGAAFARILAEEISKRLSVSFEGVLESLSRAEIVFTRRPLAMVLPSSAPLPYDDIYDCLEDVLKAAREGERIYLTLLVRIPVDELSEHIAVLTVTGVPFSTFVEGIEKSELRGVLLA